MDKSICRNRKERRGGGLAILIREDWVKRVIEITEQEEKKEIEVLMVRIFKWRRSISIITNYGIKERTEESQEEVKKQMKRWEEAVISITRRKEDLVWIGDLNVKTGNDSNGIQGNKGEITKGGKYLRK